MKLLRNYIVVLLAVAVLASCDDSNPQVIHEDSNNIAPFITLEAPAPIIDISDPNGCYEFSLADPGGNVTSYALQVSWVSPAGVSDTVDVETITSFPATICYSVADMAGFMGVAESDLAAGDSFNFVATLTSNNGTVVTPADLDGDVLNPGMDQGLTHTIFLACPVSAAFAGDYLFEQTSGPADVFFGGATAFAVEVVNVTAPDLITRTWACNYYTFGVTFNALLLCDEAVVQPTQSGVGCGGPGLNWVEDDPRGVYNPDDDAMWTINIIENVDLGCGLGATPATFDMTKQ